MGLFKKIFKRRKVVPLPPWEDIVEMMYGKELSYNHYEVVDVIYSLDKSKRYVIVKSEDGYVKCFYEYIRLYYDDVETMCEGELPAGWWYGGGNGSIYDSVETAMREMKSEPNYKNYFVQTEEQVEEEKKRWLL